MTPTYDLVIPTIGRPCLEALLERLAVDDGPAPGRVVVVDDRRSPIEPLALPELVPPGTVAVRGAGAGPASARNLGWRRCTAEWVVFVDDDVLPRPGWRRQLAADLGAAASDTVAVQGRVSVPLPNDRPPSDRERDVAGLQDAAWITADMAVRREALVRVGGFDERFRRAYREDTDLALRLMDAGGRLTVGHRQVDHPVRPASWWVSVPAQRGNADDALMDRLHGPGWRERGRSPRGLLRHHVATTVLALTAIGALLGGRRRTAAAAAVLWTGSWWRFWNHRRSPGRDTPVESVQLALTSAAIPFAATWFALHGRSRARSLVPAGSRERTGRRSTRTLPRTADGTADGSRGRPALVLFDRDGTLVHDVPYNGDPGAVVPVPGARDALDRLRAEGVAVGLITNQSGVARGLLDSGQVVAVNERVSALLGPFATVQVCEHGPGDGCERRKPSPGMVLAAARQLGVAPERCAVVGDIGSDVEAGLAAGARTVLVPTPVTRPAEVAAAPVVVADLVQAVDLLLGEGTAAADRAVAS